jgi:hypothetical protein
LGAEWLRPGAHLAAGATFGEKFDDPPLETKVPPAYDGAFGANCQYFSKPPFAKGEESWIHVLKGNTHFAMGMQPNSDTELVSLATTVAGKL